MLRASLGNTYLAHSPRDAPARLCQQHLWKESRYFCSWCPRCHSLESHNLKLEKRERDRIVKLSLSYQQTWSHSMTQNKTGQIKIFQTTDSLAGEEQDTAAGLNPLQHWDCTPPTSYSTQISVTLFWWSNSKPRLGCFFAHKFILVCLFWLSTWHKYEKESTIYESQICRSRRVFKDQV